MSSSFGQATRVIAIISAKVCISSLFAWFISSGIGRWKRLGGHGDLVGALPLLGAWLSSSSSSSSPGSLEPGSAAFPGGCVG